MAGDFFPGSKTRHGTLSGWRKHQTEGDERPCDPCYFAKQEYDARLRTSTPRQIKQRQAARAQQRALQALARLHAEEYQALYAQARADVEAEDA